MIHAPRQIVHPFEQIVHPGQKDARASAPEWGGNARASTGCPYAPGGAQAHFFFFNGESLMTFAS